MAHVRFFHGSTEGPPFDIYMNGHMYASHLGHGDWTEYEEIEPGDYTVSVYYAGMHEYPIYSTSVTIPLGGIYSYTISGLYPSISFIPVTDYCELLPGTQVLIRYVQLSTTCPTVDVACGGIALWPSCTYGTITPYAYVYPGTYTVYLYPTGTVNPCLTVPNCTLYPGNYYTFYTYGSTTSAVHPLRMHIPLDGHSYIYGRR
jgi:hypothetical protein